MIRCLYITLILTILTGATHAQDGKLGYDADLFTEGSVLPVDSIVIQAAEDDRIGFLKGSIQIGTNNTGIYRLNEAFSGKTVVELPLTVDPSGIVGVARSASEGISDELAAVIFKAGCGRWWKGRKNYWQVCVGRESCGGDNDNGRRWCTHLVSRDRCETENNCPTNNAQAIDVVFKPDLPIGILPPVDELRYCCEWQCRGTPTHPHNCQPSNCKEVPVGPCLSITMTCPGTNTQPGCTID